jgi:hypothetical protein
MKGWIEVENRYLEEEIKQAESRDKIKEPVQRMRDFRINAHLEAFFLPLALVKPFWWTAAE